MSNENSTDQAQKVLDHDYDGIREYDNRLPNWWLWILWGSIVFSIGYWLVFHTYGLAKLPLAAYEAEMEAAGGSLAGLEIRGLTESDLLAMSTDPGVLTEGQALWTQYCVVCHLTDGSGSVGPNLTDGYWMNGGSPTEIHNTVVVGVPDKGMAAWGRQFSPDRIDALVAHVLTLRDQNLPGKAPQGELYQAVPDPIPATESVDGEEVSDGSEAAPTAEAAEVLTG